MHVIYVNLKLKISPNTQGYLESSIKKIIISICVISIDISKMITLNQSYCEGMLTIFFHFQKIPDRDDVVVEY